MGLEAAETELALGEIMCSACCKKNKNSRPNCVVGNGCDHGKEGYSKSDEQAFVCDFVAEILSHLSNSSVSSGPATLMPVIYAALVKYFGRTRDRIVKRQISR